MSSEFTHEVVFSFLEFDVNVFKSILFIQRFFNLTEYREVILKKNHCSLGMQECRFEFDTGRFIEV